MYLCEMNTYICHQQALISLLIKSIDRAHCVQNPPTAVHTVYSSLYNYIAQYYMIILRVSSNIFNTTIQFWHKIHTYSIFESRWNRSLSVSVTPRPFPHPLPQLLLHLSYLDHVWLSPRLDVVSYTYANVSPCPPWEKS